jgi:hypothetical protein
VSGFTRPQVYLMLRIMNTASAHYPATTSKSELREIAHLRAMLEDWVGETITAGVGEEERA